MKDEEGKREERCEKEEGKRGRERKGRKKLLCEGWVTHPYQFFKGGIPSGMATKGLALRCNRPLLE